MKKIINITIILLFSLFILEGCTNGKCNIKTSRETPVSLELAKSVAMVHVRENNQPYNWSYIGNTLVYDVHGEQKYYILIFKKEDFTTFETLDKL